MKKAYKKLSLRIDSLQMANMICTSSVTVGDGSAENAQDNGWKLNARSNNTTLFMD